MFNDGLVVMGQLHEVNQDAFIENKELNKLAPHVTDPLPFFFKNALRQSLWSGYNP
jgi:glycerol-3-phosphate dehydrogenase